MLVDPKIDLISSLILFGVLQGVCLGIIFFLSGRKTGQIYISLFLLVLAIIELESFLNYSGFIIYLPWMINVSPPLIFLLGPLSYLYLKKILGRPEFRTIESMHFIPAACYFLYSFFFFLQPESFKINAVLRSFHSEWVTERTAPSFSMDPLDIQGFIVVEGLAIHLLIYSIICLSIILKIKFRPPATTLRIDPVHFQWITFWTLGLLTAGIIYLMTGGVINGYIVYKSILPSYTVDIFCVVVVYGTTIFWISRALVSQIEKSKYAKSPLNPDLQRQKLLKLREIMATQKPYKSQEFSLSHLARLANLSTHHASQVINSGSGMSFNEFVNLYRVEEARNILQSSVGNQVKIETLAYELGYKSKSAFFNSFKKYTETTPARFRELIVK